MSEDHPRSDGVAQSPVVAVHGEHDVPAPPPENAPPLMLSAVMRTPELSSSAAQSPSMASRQSSINTTPRQGNRRVLTASGDERKIASFRSSSSSSSVSPTNNNKVPTTLSSSANSSSRSRPLPTPMHPSLCPLLCCFYAEFDIKVGPKICYQSPANFMEQDIRLKVQQMENLLGKAFDTNNTSGLSTEQMPTESTEPEAKNDGEYDDSSLLSIFDSCSEYIITGSELSGNIINLSAHHIHVLTRPTMIADEKYERNSLLFCVGFVLRRTEDPRPFRPVLSKLALTLRDMEVESQFLSHSRPHIQTLLEGILISLNSAACECNLLLGKADVLNLKLFRPPQTPAMPVKDHAVPILLRRDRQVQSYDWDLSINWVLLHIDGIANARQISKMAEVDLEMVRACLRVLKHHGVIALVDMFCYSNRYERTEKVADSKLLGEAAEFVTKRRTALGMPSSVIPAVPSNGTANTSPELRATSPFMMGHSHHRQDLSQSALASSFPTELTLKEGSSHRLAASGGSSLHEIPLASLLKRDDYMGIKTAISEFFCACDRGTAIGELWIALVSNRFRPGSSSKVDWKKVVRLIDHRRLISFGLVHGLIRRVHKFPLLLLGNTTNGLLEKEDSPSDLFLPPASYDRARYGTTNHQHHTKYGQQEERRKIFNLATSLLDGIHCDDELVCAVELPLDAIIALFPAESIVSVFAAAEAT